ncbi:MAG: hypothetical protein Q9M92_07005 [Enterobacterales bacterium]|nr:hypothetical protein [Enterobacterales bacterium]
MSGDYLKRLNLVLALTLLTLVSLSALASDSSVFVLIEVEASDLDEIDQDADENFDSHFSNGYYSFKLENYFVGTLLIDLRPFNRHISYFANYRGPPNQF